MKTTVSKRCLFLSYFARRKSKFTIFISLTLGIAVINDYMFREIAGPKERLRETQSFRTKAELVRFGYPNNITHGGNEKNETKSYSTKKFTEMLPSDAIYSRDWWEKPTVNEEYKLIFFTIPKVACTEWKLLFRRMAGLDYQPGEKEVSFHQNPKTNQLVTLDQYPLHEAEKMMNSPEWTKAIFLREPKERIVSAYLNKFVSDRSYFRDKCCQSDKLQRKEDQQHCERMMDHRNLTYFLQRTQDCPDPHWLPQWPVIDEKWWKKISFIGRMETLSTDAKKLLETLSSVSNGENLTAWEKYGQHGWGENHTEAFLQRNSSGHSTNAAHRLCQLVQPEDEEFIEQYWQVDWKHQEYMGYKKKKICNGTSINASPSQNFFHN